MLISVLCYCRAVETLKVWREEARELKRKQDQQVGVDGQLGYQKAEEIAPFATFSTENRLRESLSTNRLKVIKFGLLDLCMLGGFDCQLCMLYESFLATNES